MSNRFSQQPIGSSLLAKCLLGLLLFLLNQSSAQAQKYPLNYFRYPLDSLPWYVSPFGSLRDNHFHSGADFKTQEREGLAVYAAADGYVSRIKVSPVGYGKALYLDHPNGYTTVYGHLQRYHGKIGAWIKQYQYKHHVFAFDTVFARPFLYVHKGDTIGLSGNSGGSTGPHLHFEIRNTKSEEIINPVFFGIRPFDTLAPALFSVHFYEFVTEGLLLKQQVKIIPKRLEKVDDHYVFKDTIQLDPDVYGIGIEAYDYIHNTKDEKSVFSYQLLHNKRICFQFEMDRFTFDNSRFINTHIDYPYYKVNKTRIQKCFLDDGNELNLYRTDAMKGKLWFKPESLDSFTLAVGDANHNALIVQLYVRAGPKLALDQTKEDYYNAVFGKSPWIPSKTNQYLGQDIHITLDPKDIYDTIYPVIEAVDRPEESWSIAWKVHETYVPLQKNIQLSLRPFPEALAYASKLCLASIGSNGKMRYAGGSFAQGWVKGSIVQFGNYCIALDSLPPKVERTKPARGKDVEESNRISFHVEDNFSGLATYAGFIDSAWVLLDFDPKNEVLTYEIDEVLLDALTRWKSFLGNNKEAIKPRFRLILTDKLGNRTERSFPLERE